MPDLLNVGLAWLTQRRSETMAETVTYSRGAASASLEATRARSVRDEVDREGIVYRYETVDWIMAASSIDFGDGPVVPQAGDVITDSGGNQYGVMSVPGEAPYRNSDTAGFSLRVHTKNL